jgi:hypothetical protein
VFKFGGWTRLKSDGKYELPVCMVGKQVRVKTDVVESDIPLLFSRSAMKKAGVKMDLENDTAVNMGKCEITSILNVRLCTAAGISPFQNGLCERVHAITNMMLIKLASENKNVEIETLLLRANMARNSLQMWNGFSSQQLVFGKNQNLPNIMQAELPALEGTTCSEAFSKHLNVLHETRKAYIQTEADERIRRALRSKVKTAEQVFENADMVFYKREGTERWLGHGKVVFQDGKVIFVRHGGVFVRVSQNRLCKVNTYFADNATKDDK